MFWSVEMPVYDPTMFTKNTKVNNIGDVESDEKSSAVSVESAGNYVVSVGYAESMVPELNCQLAHLDKAAGFNRNNQNNIDATAWVSDVRDKTMLAVHAHKHGSQNTVEPVVAPVATVQDVDVIDAPSTGNSMRR